MRLQEGGRASLRTKGGVPSEMVTRAELDFSPHQEQWRAFPFVEARWDIDDSKWSRVELGAEVGTKAVSWCPHLSSLSSEKWYLRPLSWFYVGQAFYERWFRADRDSTDQQHPSGKLESLYPGNPHTEWRTRTRFDVPLPWTIRSSSLALYAVNDYIYDLNLGRGLRNEVGAGLKIQFPGAPGRSLLLGWRHVDLVHLNDTDQFEGSVQFEF